MNKCYEPFCWAQQMCRMQRRIQEDLMERGILSFNHKKVFGQSKAENFEKFALFSSILALNTALSPQCGKNDRFHYIDIRSCHKFF